jgi:hypothetical protein
LEKFNDAGFCLFQYRPEETNQMNETRLFEKLRAIEALFEGATTDGE